MHIPRFPTENNEAGQYVREVQLKNKWKIPENNWVTVYKTTKRNLMPYAILRNVKFEHKLKNCIYSAYLKITLVWGTLLQVKHNRQSDLKQSHTASHTKDYIPK